MRALRLPSTPTPVGTVVVATTLRRPGSLATISRAPDRGRGVRRRDHSVTAVGEGSPEATPSRNAPGPMRMRPPSSDLAHAGGGAAHLADAEGHGRRHGGAQAGQTGGLDLKAIPAAHELAAAADRHLGPAAD